MSLQDALATPVEPDMPHWFTHAGHADFLWWQRSLRVVKTRPVPPPKEHRVPYVAVTDEDFAELLDELF
tara:strand:+ start:152 stop:358 length:207 start_codon:yes stop_codon:yes gene_type:complete